jgi:hypothetical protein
MQEIINQLYALRVTGVNVHLESAPFVFSTANFPTMFIRNLTFNVNYNSTLTNQRNISTVSCEYIIIVEPIKQNKPQKNYEKARELMVNFISAVESSDFKLNVNTVVIKEDFEMTEDNVFFVIIAEINCNI